MESLNLVDAIALFRSLSFNSLYRSPAWSLSWFACKPHHVTTALGDLVQGPGEQRVLQRPSSPDQAVRLYFS